jgi:hypothetical protein
VCSSVDRARCEWPIDVARPTGNDLVGDRERAPGAGRIGRVLVAAHLTGTARGHSLLLPGPQDEPSGAVTVAPGPSGFDPLPLAAPLREAHPVEYPPQHEPDAENSER